MRQEQEGMNGQNFNQGEEVDDFDGTWVAGGLKLVEVAGVSLCTGLLCTETNYIFDSCTLHRVVLCRDQLHL